MSDFKSFSLCGQLEVPRWKAPANWLVAGREEEYVVFHGIISKRHCSSIMDKDSIS